MFLISILGLESASYLLALLFVDQASISNHVATSTHHCEHSLTTFFPLTSSSPCAGREAAGIVTAVGPGLTGRKVGDVVAYAGNPMGSYAEEQILPASVAVPIPPSIDPIVAASIMLKGMTAQFLLRRCFKV